MLYVALKPYVKYIAPVFTVACDVHVVAFVVYVLYVVLVCTALVHTCGLFGCCLVALDPTTNAHPHQALLVRLGGYEAGEVEAAKAETDEQNHQQRSEATEAAKAAEMRGQLAMRLRALMPHSQVASSSTPAARGMEAWFPSFRARLQSRAAQCKRLPLWLAVDLLQCTAAN